ncbi:DUF937 domain-containing protein [Spirosoma arcticum]
MNLLELANSYISNDVVEQVSTTLGETPQNTQTAINGALPTVLGGLIQKSAEPGGIGGIMDMVAQVITPNRAGGEVITPEGGVFSQLGSLFDGNDGTQMSSFMSMGSGLVTSLFGDKAEGIASALSAHSGIKQTSASSLMSLVTPVLLGVLGKRIEADGSGLSGLAGLLSSQAGSVQTALPSGLASRLGGTPEMATTENLNSPSARVEPDSTTLRVTPPVAPSTTSPVAVGDVDQPVAGIPAFSNDHTSGGGSRWLPWLLLALGVAALLYFLMGCSSDRSGANTDKDNPMADTANVASDANTDTKIGPAIDSISSAAKATLDSAQKR